MPRPCPCVFRRDRAGILILNPQLRRYYKEFPFPRRPLRFNFNRSLDS